MPSKTAQPSADASPEAQLGAFIARFSPSNQRLIRRLRVGLRELLPAANELVYDNYNFLVVAYSPTEKTSDSFFSIGADRNGANLFFGYNGTKLHDPNKLLRGNGALNRFMRLESAAAIDDPAVRALIHASVTISKPMSDEGGRLIIRSVSVKQRSRR